MEFRQIKWHSLHCITLTEDEQDVISNGPISRKGSTMRINSMTPSSSSQHIMNGCNGDNNSEHNRTLERDGRNSSISSSHSPHRTHTSNSSYNTITENQINKSHHHSLDRESNNKTYREMGSRQFYNTNPKPQAHAKQQQQQQKQQKSQQQSSRQSMPMKCVAAKSHSNLGNSIISKSDANMATNSSDEGLNIDRMSIHSQCNSDIYKNRHMILSSTSSNKSSKQYCKYHNFN